MKIGLGIDTTGIERKTGLTAKNIAYATVNAINQTALEVQKQAQENVKAKFTLRKPDFVLRNVAIIKPFASVGQGRPFAEIAVGQKPRLLLPEFEEGGTRQPFVGKSVAVPITGSPARPSFASPVADNLRIASLRMRPPLSGAQRAQRKTIKGSNAKETRALRADYTRAQGASSRVWKGDDRTYMIRGLGIFQRQGKGLRDTTLIYKFVPRPVLKPRLGFLAMAKGYGQDRFAGNLETQLVKEIARARR